MWWCLALLFLLAGPLAPADERTAVLEAVEPLASALSNGSAGDFMRAIDENAPERERLRNNVEALLAFAEVTSSVDVLRLQKGSADLDWYMEIRARITLSVTERRRGTVTVRVSDGKLQELRPVDFFRLIR